MRCIDKINLYNISGTTKKATVMKIQQSNTFYLSGSVRSSYPWFNCFRTTSVVRPLSSLQVAFIVDGTSATAAFITCVEPCSETASLLF